MLDLNEQSPAADLEEVRKLTEALTADENETQPQGRGNIAEMTTIDEASFLTEQEQTKLEDDNVIAFQNPLDDIKAANNEQVEIETQAVTQAEFVVNAQKRVWSLFATTLLEKLGDTEENRDWVLKAISPLQAAFLSASYHGAQFIEYFNQSVNARRPLDLPILYLMNDHMRGFLNHATALPFDIQNVWDEETAGGSVDPRWSTETLPTEEIIKAQGKLRIPVKVETFGEIIYGYLQCFEYQQQAKDQLVTIVTTIPALKVKESYVAVNAIYRWIRVDDETVKNAWNTGRSIIVKKTAKAPAEGSNPIEDNPEGPSDEV